MNFDDNSQFGKIQSADIHHRDANLDMITNFYSNTDEIPTVLHVSPDVPVNRVPGIQSTTKITQKRKSTSENTVSKRQKEGEENCKKKNSSKTYLEYYSRLNVIDTGVKISNLYSNPDLRNF